MESAEVTAEVVATLVLFVETDAVGATTVVLAEKSSFFVEFVYKKGLIDAVLSVSLNVEPFEKSV